MKRKIYFMLATSSLLGFGSCRKGDSEKMEPTQTAHALKSDLKAFLIKNNTYSEMGRIIANSVFDSKIVQEVYTNTKLSLSLGLDETFYLKDIVNDVKKINKNIKSDLFISLINENLQNSPVSSKQANSKGLAGTSGIDKLKILLNEADYQIYWPYVEDWDGKEKPAIVFIDETNENNDKIAALIPLKDNPVKFDTIIVDEDYAKKHPVWVLSKKSDLSYSEIPALASGERTKGNVYFSEINHLEDKVSVSNQNLKSNVNLVSNTATQIYNVKLGRFMATKQWDPWLKGGSEFYLLFTETSVNSNVGGNANEIGASTSINMIFVDRPRKTISKKRWVDVYKNAVSNWRPEVHKSTLVIMEKDWEGWGVDERKIPYDIPVTVQGKTYNIKGDIIIEKRDDHITTKVYDRNYIFSNLNFSNNNWTTYSENGVNWTLPYTIGTSITN
ncbi:MULTISPECIES: hypothetical protein [unclassified Sphingobacterium]|uniref:hypothetical protein n=1 Tax=unclassified Sphingobacterium TaxID=2609468 RepID=UPI001052FF90|nr:MULTISPECIES: hypothetical protein [unclassified Sphingobacterium]MBB2951645.1 hypothetical protein [Sphingobacterium sp. JUb56]MCS3557502.1 hypothetical protein [Sphingobacterium sp. JUb21]TCQ95888.1 hypothetical protein EDF66_1242 [Sphingobacterium sp. JUb20]